MYDVKYLGGSAYNQNSFEVKPADNSIQPQYVWKGVHSVIKNERNLFRSGYEIESIEKGSLLARYYEYSYVWLYGPLETKEVLYCPHLDNGNDGNVNLWQRKISSVFMR